MQFQMEPGWLPFYPTPSVPRFKVPAGRRRCALPCVRARCEVSVRARAALPTTVVVDHMGRPDVAKPVDGAEFELFVRLMREHDNIWSKVSCPERLSISGPPALQGEQHAYRDVVPFARRLVEAFPDRVLWGTDWPHPNLKDHMPDDGLLVDWIRASRSRLIRSANCWSTIPCVCIGRK